MDGKTLPAGTVLQARLLVVGAPFTTPPDDAWIHRVRDAMGLAGGGYGLEIHGGRVRSQRYVLDVDAQGAGFTAAIPAAPLPMALPLKVEGVNDRWSVYLLDRARHQARPLGHAGSAAYATVDAREGPQDLYIGHPVTASDPEVAIEVAPMESPAGRITVHNPTPQRRSVVVSSPAGWTLWRLPPTRLDLAPGAIAHLSPHG